MVYALPPRRWISGRALRHEGAMQMTALVQTHGDRARLLTPRPRGGPSVLGQVACQARRARPKQVREQFQLKAFSGRRLLRECSTPPENEVAAAVTPSHPAPSELLV